MKLFTFREGSVYLAFKLLFHKAFETGFQRSHDGGFDLYWRFTSRGDHAGLKFYVEAFHWMFEFNVYDTRHWNWGENRWQTKEDPVFEGYPY